MFNKPRCAITFDFGFSYVGLVYLIMLMTPNLIWSKNLPKDYEKFAKNENKVLLAVYGKNIFLGISIVILGIGHIGIHLMHRKEAKHSVGRTHLYGMNELVTDCDRLAKLKFSSALTA